MKKIVVVGDIMLDTWMYGDVDRVSPEAPIPVLKAKEEYNYLGGAGNVAANIHYLGAKPIIYGGIGNDHIGIEIQRQINELDMGSWLYDIKESHHKLRVCSGQQQIVRIDRGSIDETDCSKNYNLDDQDFDAMIISDYGKGAINRENLENLSFLCKSKKAKLLIDPYPNRNYYSNGGFHCDVIKFNKKEAELFLQTKITDQDSAIRASNAILYNISTNAVVITLGEDGILYFDKEINGPIIVKEETLNVYDVCGAGDVVISVLAYFMAHDNYSKTTMIKSAAKAGRIAVSKKRTSFVTVSELFDGFEGGVE